MGAEPGSERSSYHTLATIGHYLTLHGRDRDHRLQIGDLTTMLRTAHRHRDRAAEPLRLDRIRIPGTDLHGLHLAGARLAWADLFGCDLRDKTLTDAFLTGTELAGYDFSENASTEPAMVFGELYPSRAEWRFPAIGQGVRLRDRGHRPRPRRHV